MVVMARINVNVPEMLNDSLVEIRDLLSRFVVYREDDPDRPDTNEMSEGRSADRSYIPSDIGTDVDEDEMGVFPDKPDAIHLLQVKAICVDEPNEASYLSGFIDIILFKVWKVFANNEADSVKDAGKGGGMYCPYIAVNGRDDMLLSSAG